MSVFIGFAIYLALGLPTVYLRGRLEHRIIALGGKVNEMPVLALLILWPLALPFVVHGFGRYRK